MKFAIIGDRGIPARYSGFSTLIEQMATRMVNEYGFDVTIYCRSNYYEDRPKFYNGVRCVYLPAPGGKSLESIIHSNLSILHATFCSYDVVLVLDPGNGPFVLPLRIRGFPILMHTDGMGWKRQKWSPFQQKYYKWSEKITAWFSHWLITDSKAMQQYYVDEYQADSSFIPYAGEVGEGLDDSILQEHGLEKNSYYLCCARIEPDNNIDLVIREYRLSKSNKPLIVVGDARYDTAYGRAISAENDELVRCIGGVYDKEKLNSLFTHSYAYFHGHEVGGTNPSLLNAMHRSAAPVAMDVIFHREVMTDEGLFFSKEPNQLASIIRKLEQDESIVTRLKTLAKQRSDAHYRWDAVVDGYVKVISILKDGYKNKQSLSNSLSQEVYEPLEFYNKKKQ